MPKITQENGILFIEFSEGSVVDVAMQQSLYRQRKALFDTQGQRKQKIIHLGEIGDLNMAAAKYSCSDAFADITEAKVIVVSSSLNQARASMMHGTQDPTFPVYVTNSLADAVNWLKAESWKRQE